MKKLTGAEPVQAIYLTIRAIVEKIDHNEAVTTAVDNQLTQFEKRICEENESAVSVNCRKTIKLTQPKPHLKILIGTLMLDDVFN